MKTNFKFIAYVRNEEYPSSDCFKVIVNIDNPEIARNFFGMNGFYVCPDDLVPFLTPRQLSRFKTFYNKPRYFDLFVLDIKSYKSAF